MSKYKRTIIKETIIKVVKNVSAFSLFDFLLMRKVNSIEKDIDLKGGLIDYHKGLIKDAENLIDGSMEAIADLHANILGLKDKLDLIDKI